MCDKEKNTRTSDKYWIGSVSLEIPYKLDDHIFQDPKRDAPQKNAHLPTLYIKKNVLHVQKFSLNYY